MGTLEEEAPPISLVETITVTTDIACALNGTFSITYTPPTGPATTLTSQVTPATFTTKKNTSYSVGTIQSSVNGTTYAGSSPVTGTVPNTNGAEVTVTLDYDDTTNPTITAPAAVTVDTDAGECSATEVDLGEPTTDDNCGVASVENDAPATFPKGETTVIWTVTDTSGNKATDEQLVTVEDNEAPVLDEESLAEVTGECPVDLPTAPTATDACDGTITGTPDEDGPFTESTTITWTFEDESGNTSTQTQDIVVNDTTAPVLSGCPADAMLPEGTITPDKTVVTASDACEGDLTEFIVYSQVINGNIVTRTWTVEDTAGNESSCTQVITWIDPNLVTGSSLCHLNQECGDGVQAFRLAFNQRPDAPNNWKLTSSNPGQFQYAVFASGTPGESVSLTATLPYPFVTHGSQPIRVFQDYQISGTPDKACLSPRAAAKGFTIATAGTSVSPSGAPIVLLTDFAGVNLSSTSTVTVSGTFPETGTILVMMHLEYGLKGTTAWTLDGNGVPTLNVSGLASNVKLTDCLEYTFSSDVTSGEATASYEQTIASVNAIKRNAGFGMSICNHPALGNDPIAGVTFQIWDAKGTKKVGEATSDENGTAFLPFKHKAKAAEYQIKVPSYNNKTIKVTIKANGFGFAEFIVP